MKQQLMEFVGQLKKVRLDLEEDCIYGFIHAISDQLLLIKINQNFLNFGYTVVRLADIKCCRSDAYERRYESLLEKEGLLEQYRVDKTIPLSDWKSFLSYFLEREEFIILETYNSQGYIYPGKVVRMSEKKVWFHSFNTKGQWDKKPMCIPFKKIAWIQFDTPYINIFSKYTWSDKEHTKNPFMPKDKKTFHKKLSPKQKLKKLDRSFRKIRLDRPFPGEPYLDCFVHQSSRKLVWVQDIVDFYPNGSSIIKRTDITDMRLDDHDLFYEEMMRKEGLLDLIQHGNPIPLLNWSTVLSYFFGRGEIIFIECESTKDEDMDRVYLGKIAAIYDDFIWFATIDFPGDWDDLLTKIQFKDITRVQYDTLFLKIFSRHAPPYNINEVE